MMPTAKQIVTALLDEATSPFAAASVTLQYRPFQRDGTWQWYWVLLPEDGQQALATGCEDSIGEASTKARAAARHLGVNVHKTETLTPHPAQSSNLAVTEI